ncbi:Ribosomal large subunit pseudouridine synthase D [bacterium HR15]|nr:Ribosomal large subunit pseudouridine synthase D [bacterium HR15]
MEGIVEQGGSRLDKWLAERFPQVSRQRWQEWIEAGGVQVNGERVKPAYKLRTGDRVEYTLPPERPPAIDLRPEPIPIEIVYEDDQLLVVNKPRGLTVHPAPGHPHGTLVNALLAYAPRLAQGSAPFRPGIVHRLDKDTTGLLIVAKTDHAHARLAADLQQRAIERRYLALVWGEPKWEQHSVDLPIGRHPVERKRMIAFSHPKQPGAATARPARTHLTVRQRWRGFALLEAKLETGRTHQVRVHLSAIGHPVVGDPLYGGRRPLPASLYPPAMHARIQAALDTLPAQLLHAYALAFHHPLTGEPIRLTAPLPDDFKQLIALLRSASGTGEEPWGE